MAEPEIPVQDAGTYRGIQIWWLPYMNIYRFTYGEVEYEAATLTMAHGMIDDLLAPIEPEVPPIVEPPPPPPPIEPEEPPTFEAPTLPWYAAWLKPIINFIGLLTESVANFFAPIFAPIGQAATNLANLPRNIIVSVIDGIKTMGTEARTRAIDTALKTVGEAAKGSPEWMGDLTDKLGILEKAILKGYSEALDVATYEKSPLTGEEAISALADMKSKVLATAVFHFALHAIVESGSLGQFEFMKELEGIVTSKFGLNRILERATMMPIEKAIFTPAEYEMNTRYPYVIPTYADLINMVVKEVIDLDRFRAEMKKLGFSEEWSTFIWDAHFKPPDMTQLLQAYYRGSISREELETFKVLVDLDPRYNVVWDSLIEVIPPYSELVNELVKEVIDRKEFEKYLQWHGYDKKWADRIWDAHFLPPSLGDILTAWRRGLITEDRVDELMILVDLDPRYKEIFDTRKYVDPSLREARYMFELGAIDRGQVENYVARRGYTPDDAANLVEYLTTFQERGVRARYLTALMTGVIYGAYTPDELTAAVVEAGYSKEVAGWMIKTAEVRTRITETRRPVVKVRLLDKADLRKAFLRDLVTEDVYRTELMARGYEISNVDILVDLLTGEKVTEDAGKRKIALSQSELLNAWRYELISEDQVRTTLQLRGLAVDEVEILLNTKKKQWGLEVE